MRVEFPYPTFAGVEIPDANFGGVYEPRKHPASAMAAGTVATAIANPIGSQPLPEMARGAKSVLIISDDYTRQTPVKQIIPQIATAMLRLGVRQKAIKILVALGTHRPMTQEEKVRKFGLDITRTFDIINHNWVDADDLVSVGKLSTGMEVRVNRLVTEADLVIGLGQVVPHRIAGFSGGAKIILPGVCGSAATGYTHWIGAQLPGEQVLGVWDNPVRRLMNEAGQLAKLRFIVNAVCDPEGHLIDVVAGDPVAAHGQAANVAREVFGARVPTQLDIVIVDSFPKDIELWQAAKALYAAELMVRQGGAVILVSPCTEGVSRTHALISERGYKSEAETMADIREKRLTDPMVASHCLRVGRVIRDRATGYLVSSGINPELARHLGFIPAATAQEALNSALLAQGKGARVAVLRNGGESLPVMGI